MCSTRDMIRHDIVIPSLVVWHTKLLYLTVGWTEALRGPPCPCKERWASLRLGPPYPCTGGIGAIRVLSLPVQNGVGGGARFGRELLVGAAGQRRQRGGGLGAAAGPAQDADTLEAGIALGALIFRALNQ